MASFAEGLAQLQGDRTPAPVSGRSHALVRAHVGATASPSGTTWVSSLPDPITADQAVARLDEVLDYSRNAWFQVCRTGTCPPADYWVPELVRLTKTVQELRDGLQVLVDKNVGRFNLAPKVRAGLIKNGPPVFDEADRVVAASQSGQTLPAAVNTVMQTAAQAWESALHPTQNVERTILIGAAVLGGVYLGVKLTEALTRRRAA
jgi:hypothetical protein